MSDKPLILGKFKSRAHLTVALIDCGFTEGAASAHAAEITSMTELGRSIQQQEEVVSAKQQSLAREQKALTMLLMFQEAVRTEGTFDACLALIKGNYE
jgi:hypothetical protein